jgi:hypothetical protein
MAVETEANELTRNTGASSKAPKLSVDCSADLLHNPQRFQSKVSGFCAAVDRGAYLSATIRGQTQSQGTSRCAEISTEVNHDQV